MKIKLVNTNVTPIWSVFGTDIHLSFINDSIEVDESKLTEEQKKEIVTAAQKNIITVEGLELEEKIPLTPQEQVEQLKQEKIKNAQDFLSQKLADLKKQLKEKNISELRSLLQEEKMSKSRKTVLQTIEKLIFKHQKDVFKKLGTEKVNIEIDKKQDLKEIFGGLASFYVDNIGEAEEDDYEEIEVSLGG